jgi:hypothetical protein
VETNKLGPDWGNIVASGDGTIAMWQSLSRDETMIERQPYKSHARTGETAKSPSRGEYAGTAGD